MKNTRKNKIKRKYKKKCTRRQRGGGGMSELPRPQARLRVMPPPPLEEKIIKPPDNPILPEDILFQDNDVCILKPGVKKGVLIFTHYKQPAGMASLCEAGLKTGVQLQREGVNFGRNMIHDYIFFRAPYFSDLIDYTSIDTEITSSFGNNESAEPSRVWIRIDPERTRVYSSEIRAKFSPNFMYGSPEYLFVMENEVIKSRKTMNEYLQILDINKSQIKYTPPGEKLVYNLFSSKVVGSVPIKDMSYEKSPYRYPNDSENINRTSEVLVRVPHLTPNYFVKCT
jgi:hypothetical protein